MNIDLNLAALSIAYGEIDVTMDILCPAGLANHYWFADIAHDDQDLYKDYLESTKNRNAYMFEQKGDEYKPIIPLSYEAFLESEHYEPEDTDYYKEFVTLYTNCVWDIFSGNNSVMLDGKKVDLGTWRGSAQFLADFVNHSTNSGYHFTGADFYCGNIDDKFRAEYLPLYELIFTRLKAESFNWVIDEDITLAVDAEFGEEMEHRPDTKLNEQHLIDALKENMNEEQLKRVKEELEKERAKKPGENDELPAIVLAYLNVYGVMPAILKK